MNYSKQGPHHRDWKLRQHHANPTLGLHHRSNQEYATNLTLTKSPMATTVSQLRRIILANQPRLLREMLGHVFAVTPGLQVVAEVDAPSQLLTVLGETEAHWLIVTLDSHTLENTHWPSPSQINALAAKIIATPVSLMAISPDGRQVEIQTTETEGGRHTYTLYDISLAHLLSILS